MSKVPPAFQGSYCKTGLDWIGLVKGDTKSHIFPSLLTSKVSLFIVMDRTERIKDTRRSQTS